METTRREHDKIHQENRVGRRVCFRHLPHEESFHLVSGMQFVVSLRAMRQGTSRLPATLHGGSAYANGLPSADGLRTAAMGGTAQVGQAS